MKLSVDGPLAEGLFIVTVHGALMLMPHLVSQATMLHFE